MLPGDKTLGVALIALFLLALRVLKQIWDHIRDLDFAVNTFKETTKFVPPNPVAAPAKNKRVNDPLASFQPDPFFEVVTPKPENDLSPEIGDQFLPPYPDPPEVRLSSHSEEEDIIALVKKDKPKVIPNVSPQFSPPHIFEAKPTLHLRNPPKNPKIRPRVTRSKSFITYKSYPYLPPKPDCKVCRPLKRMCRNCFIEEALHLIDDENES